MLKRLKLLRRWLRRGGRDNLFENAFHHAAIGMALVALDGSWLRVNRSVCELLGYSSAELLHTTFQAITHPDDLEADLKFVRRLLLGDIQTYRMEKRYYHKQGHIVWGLLSVSLVRNHKDEPQFFISQIQDITDRKHFESQLAEQQRELESANRFLEELSNTDELTGMHSRRSFNAELEREVELALHHRSELSLILLDIDEFQECNAVNGSPGGDDVLRHLGTVLWDASRRTDFVARYGGDEFAIILPQTEMESANQVAERYRQQVQEALLARGVTLSVGVATLQHNSSANSAVGLVARANAALCESKRSGRNCCTHASGLMRPLYITDINV